MKKILIYFFMVFFLSSFFVFAQENTEAKAIPNLVSAVRDANPGDYIVLPSGRRYVLTEAEIEILKGNFDYGDLSALPSETRDDGTEVITISEAHTAYIYPDGQSIHMLRSGRSFTEYMNNYIENRYYPGRYLDYYGNSLDSGPAPDRNISVFRAAVEFRLLSDGIDVYECIYVTAYNYRGRTFRKAYFPSSDWVWGNVRSSRFSFIGESRTLEFDIE